SSDGKVGTLILDPPAPTTTAGASTTTADASIPIADASITTTDASTTTADATVTPVAKASTLSTTKTASSRTNATLAAVDEAVLAALNTAVVVAATLDNAVAGTDAGEMSSVTISGNNTAVDITGTVSGSDSVTANSDAAPEVNPISQKMAGTLTDNGTVEVINGTPAGAVPETGAVKADTVELQLDGSDEVDALVTTDGPNADAINLPGEHTTKAAWHVSDDGRGGKTTHETPAQSTSADNHFSVSSSLTETPRGDGDHSA